MDLREMTASDLPCCAELYVRAFNAPPWNDQWDTSSASARLGRLLGMDGFLGICAVEEQRCVAFAAGYVEDWHAASHYCLKEMCVDPALQRRGIGTELMTRLFSQLAGRGVSSVRLGTRRGSPAEAFYAKLGFVAADWLIHMKRDVTATDVGQKP